MFSNKDMLSNKDMFSNKDMLSNKDMFSNKDMLSNKDMFSNKDRELWILNFRRSHFVFGLFLKWSQYVDWIDDE